MNQKIILFYFKDTGVTLYLSTLAKKLGRHCISLAVTKSHRGNSTVNFDTKRLKFAHDSNVSYLKHL